MDLFGSCCSPASSNSSNSKTVMTTIQEKVEPERGEHSTHPHPHPHPHPEFLSWIRSGGSTPFAVGQAAMPLQLLSCAASDSNMRLTHGPPFGLLPLSMLCPRTCAQPMASIHHFIRTRPRACPRQCPRLGAGLLHCQQSVAGCVRPAVPVCTVQNSCVVHYKHLRRVINPRAVCKATAI